MITVVCSDRGNHPVRRVAVAWLDADGADLGPTPWVGRSQKDAAIAPYSAPVGDPVPDPAAVTGQLADVQRYELRCPTCGRHPQMRRETWQRLAEALTSAGKTRVDISALPF